MLYLARLLKALRMACQVVNRVHVKGDVVIFEAAELVLPRARATDREIAAGEKVILVGILVRVGWEHGISVEPPVRLDAGPTVVVARRADECHAIG